MRLGDLDALKENMMIAFDCENATKYGNKDAEQQAHSYSTLMLYEISNIVEDCIDNAPTIEQEIYITGEASNLYIDGYREGMKDYKQLVAKIEELEKFERPQGEWIPVSERLPEESLNSVIGWDAYRERCVFVQYIDGYFQITGSVESFNIVAWQPLPEPYKEGGVE